MYTSRDRRDTTGPGSGIPVRLPAAPALPNTRDIERALRPLMRRVPSRTKLVFDEAATVHRIAEERIWVPVLQPAPERWFEVALVIDESASMVIWQQTIAEFQHLLERLGAFRDLRMWRLATNAGKVRLYAGTSRAVEPRRPRDPSELIDPTGRRLILVVSDCVAPAWRDGQVTELLATWTRVSPVALVQVLSQRLWRGSALGEAIEVSLLAPAAGIPNVQLQTADWWISEALPNGLKMPIVTLEPEFLAIWARLVIGAGDTSAPGFLLDPSPAISSVAGQQKSDTAPRSPQERLRGFQAKCTPEAYKLATYLATVQTAHASDNAASAAHHVTRIPASPPGRDIFERAS